jgi:uncharacterized membrane protein
MANTPTVGNRVAPWRFLAFLVIMLAAILPARAWLGTYPLGIIGAFDLAAGMFLALSWRLLTIDDPNVIERIAEENDTNRTLLLALTFVVTAVLLIAVGAETVGRQTGDRDKGLIIATLIIAWLFSNTVYALHYAHMAYAQPGRGCRGFRFPGTDEPVYWDFVYFAFTCGMAFATSDVEVTDQRVRKVVTFHCLAAFAFNIGVLAFTINLLASGGG